MLKLASNRKLEILVRSDGEDVLLTATVSPLKASEKLNYDSQLLPIQQEMSKIPRSADGSIQTSDIDYEAVIKLKKIWREIGDKKLLDISPIDPAEGLTPADTVRQYAPEIVERVGQMVYEASSVAIDPGKSESKSNS